MKEENKKKSFIIKSLWVYLIILGIFFLAIIPPQIRYLNHILNQNPHDVGFNSIVSVIGTIIPIFVAVGIFVGGICIISLKNWTRLLVIYSCVGINLEIIYMSIAWISKIKDLYLFFGIVFILCGIPVFYLTRPKVKEQFK